MKAYIIRRLLLIMPTLFILSILVFLSVRFIPGDVVDVMIGRMEYQTMGALDREAVERRLGLDVPACSALVSSLSLRRRVEIDALTYAEYHERMFSRTGEGMYSGMTPRRCGQPIQPCLHGKRLSHGSPLEPRPVQWPELDVRVDAVNGARTTEEQQRLIAEADRYAMSRHWLIYGPKSPSFYLAQPWLVGYNGELDGALSRVESNTLFARLWIDSALKKEMGY